MKKIKIIVFVLILTFYGSLLVHKINLTVSDDLPRQVTIGQNILQGNFYVLYKNTYSYTEPDFRFFDHHWFSGVVFYLFYQAIGWSGLEILKIIVLLSAFCLLFMTALKKADFWLVSAFSLPTILILMGRTTTRPEIFSYLFIAIYVYLLVSLDERAESKKIFWLIPLQLLWVNMHVFFSVGIMLVGGFLLEKIILNFKNFWQNPLIKRLFVVFFALIIVSFINPRGFRGVFYSYPHNFPVSITENQSMADFKKGSMPWADVSIQIFPAIVAVLALSFILGFRRKNFFYFFGSVATSILAFFVLRGMYLFGLIFLLAVTANFNSVFIKTRDWFKSESPAITKILSRGLVAGLLLSILLLIFFRSALAPSKQWGVGLAPGSLHSINFFKDNNLKGPIFNDADSGSYLIHFLYPQEKVFVDNRFADAYSADFFQNTYLPIFNNEDAWREQLKKYNFNTIFMYQYSRGSNVRNFLWKRIRDPEWSLVYVDKFNIIFVKNVPKNQEVIQKFGITHLNAEKRLAYLTNSNDENDQIAVADIFNLLGLEDMATQIFLDVLSKYPDRAKVWRVLGEWELLKNDPRSPLLSMMFLDKAISLGYKSSGAYSYLGAAYYKLNRPASAKAALEKSLKINPDREDAQKLLNLINQVK